MKVRESRLESLKVYYGIKRFFINSVSLISFLLLLICSCEQPFTLQETLDEPIESQETTSGSESPNYNTISIIQTGGTAGGGAIVGEFTFQNNGAGDGSNSVFWQVYTSLDTTIGTGDSLIDSGTTSPLIKGTTSIPISFNGFWPVPVTDKTYNLIVQISAADDSTSTDNLAYISSVITAPLPGNIDYIVESITNSPATAEINTPIAQSFTFQNQGNDPGKLIVYWSAYLSTDTQLNGADILIDNGTLEALEAGVSSGAINISGNWPTAGIYYLIVQVSSGDDSNPSNNYSSSASFTINASTTDIDYIVSNITRNYPNVTTNSLISETFDLSNIGGLNGTQQVSWTAYASLNESIGPEDEIIGSGTTALSGLNAGSTAYSIPISGSWPSTEGNYYLLVKVSSSDETITTNNSNYNGMYSVINPPDYEITSVTLQYQGEPSTLLSTYGAFSFAITETANESGNQPISWEVFASTDTILDGSDVSLKSGNISALSANGTSSLINFADSTWPAFGAEYYIIISINSGDDSNTSNNTYIDLISVTVPELYTEGAENNSDTGPTGASLTLVSDVDSVLQGGSLSNAQLIIAEGTMDDETEWDTYKITTGSDTFKLFLDNQWNTGFDDLNLYIWDESNNQWSSVNTLKDRETIPLNVSPNTTYYIGVDFIRAGSAGEPYSLIIQGK